MTCETVRERLLEESTASFAELEPHLATCPDCAALAQRIVEDERALRQELEAFVNAPTPPLPNVDSAPGGPRWFHGALVALAIAAVLLLTLLQPPPGRVRVPFEHDDPPAKLVAAARSLDGFLDLVDEGVPDRTGLERAEEDKVLVEHLNRLAKTMAELEEELVEVSEDPDPEVELIALYDLGVLYSGMADALLKLDHPSYLNEKQSEVYQMALEDKSWVQHDKAMKTFEQALELAEDLELPAEIDALEHAMSERKTIYDAIAERQKDWEEAQPEPPPAQELIDRVDALEAQVDACSARLDPGSIEEVENVVEQVRQVVDAQTTSMYHDVSQLLAGYEKAIAEACSD